MEEEGEQFASILAMRIVDSGLYVKIMDHGGKPTLHIAGNREFSDEFLVELRPFLEMVESLWVDHQGGEEALMERRAKKLNRMFELGYAAFGGASDDGSRVRAVVRAVSAHLWKGEVPE